MIIWKIIIFLILNVFCLEYLQSQLIYFSDEGGNLHTVDLSDGNCNVTTLGTMYRTNDIQGIFAPSDITFHPNGTLYGTDGFGLYEIDLNTLDANLVGYHNADFLFLINSLVCNNDGVMYASELKLYSINVGNGEATELGLLPYATAGDMAYNNGKLYGACLNNIMIEIDVENPSASTVVGTINSADNFFGIVTFATDCSDLQTYGTSNASLYQLDVNDANATFICQLITNNFTIWGATMETDYIASDCDFIVDLDLNNSSGAMNFDYIDTICGNTPSPIADLDVNIVAEGVVDSMLIWISAGIQDGTDEQLLLSSVTNMQVFGSGTSQLKLVSTGIVTEYDLEDALVNASYINNDINYNPGIREIAVKFYAQGGEESNLATAFIHLVEPNPFSIVLVPDTSMCEGEILIINAYHLQADSYEWQDGSTNAILEVTSSGIYSVTATDICSNTAIASMNVFFSSPSSTMELGPDTILCDDESLVLNVTIPEAMAYLWQDGNSSPVMNVTQTGIYAVSVTLDCGIITDEISVVYEEIINISLFEEDTLICDGEPLILDVSFPNALSYEWQNGENTPNITIYEAGIYGVNVQFQCGELNDEIYVNYIDYVLTVDLGLDTSFCYGESFTLTADSPLATSYQWQDNSIESSFSVRETGNYSVTVSDACQEATDVVYVEVVSCCNLYIPNIFTPNFDGTNDEVKVYADCEFPSYNFKIFNRWGALVFETNDQEKGWDGVVGNEKANQGVYIWLIEYHDGVEVQMESGDLTLIR